MVKASEGSRTDNGALGTSSEARVLARLVDLGFNVSIPFGGRLRYDLIADNGGQLSRVQVKTGRLRETSVGFSCATASNIGTSKRSYRGDADVFVVYCPDNGEMYWVPVDETGPTGNMSLRVKSAFGDEERSNLRWAKDYVLAGQLSVTT